MRTILGLICIMSGAAIAVLVANAIVNLWSLIPAALIAVGVALMWRHKSCFNCIHSESWHKDCGECISKSMWRGR